MSEKLIEDANRRLKDARESLKGAEKKLEPWKSRPGFSSNPDYLKLEKQVEECRAMENQYLNLVAVYQELVSRNKRGLDDTETSSLSSKSSGSRPGQSEFVQRLIERDCHCPILGTPASRCVACHIVSYYVWKKDKAVCF